VPNGHPMPGHKQMPIWPSFKNAAHCSTSQVDAQGVTATHAVLLRQPEGTAEAAICAVIVALAHACCVDHIATRTTMLTSCKLDLLISRQYLWRSTTRGARAGLQGYAGQDINVVQWQQRMAYHMIAQRAAMAQPKKNSWLVIRGALCMRIEGHHGSTCYVHCYVSQCRFA
jgi:hypothetical protein